MIFIAKHSSLIVAQAHSYTFPLYNQPYLQDKEHILELITELYLLFPDSLIQYTEKNLCGIEDSKIIEPCIFIDWS